MTYLDQTQFEIYLLSRKFLDFAAFSYIRRKIEIIDEPKRSNWLVYI